MKLTFNITGFLTDFSGGQREIPVESDSRTVGAALGQLWELHVGLRDRVINEQGHVRQHVNIFLNNENVKRLQSLETPVKNGDEITILPSVSGGTEEDQPQTGVVQEFFVALEKGDEPSVLEFLETDPELVNTRSDGATPLHVAAITNQRSLVDELLARGADLNGLDDEFNMTPIGWANEKGYMAMVAYLFGRGAHVDLISGAAYGLKDRVQQLLDEDTSKINEYERGRYGAAIHEASLWGNVDVLNLLLARGADTTSKNRYGETALEIAKNQLESNCKATPIVIDSRRAEIAAGCRAVLERLSSA